PAAGVPAGRWRGPTARASRPAAATTDRRAYGSNTARRPEAATTRRSCSTPTATTSKPSAASSTRDDDAPGPAESHAAESPALVPGLASPLRHGPVRQETRPHDDRHRSTHSPGP